MLGWSRLPALGTSWCLPPPVCAGWVYFGAGALGGWQMGEQVSKQQERAPSYSFSIPDHSSSIPALPQTMGMPRVGLSPCPATEMELGCQIAPYLGQRDRAWEHHSQADRPALVPHLKNIPEFFSQQLSHIKGISHAWRTDWPWGETQQPLRVTWTRASPITLRLGCPSLKPNFVFLCWQNTAISSSSAPTDIPHAPRLEIHSAHNRTMIAIFHILLVVFFSHTSVMFNKSLLNLTAVVCQKHRHSISHISSTLE